MGDFFLKAIGVGRADINNMVSNIVELSRLYQRPTAPSSQGPSSSSAERENTTMGNGGFSGTNVHSSQDTTESDASPQNEMACDNCSAKFTLFKTKKMCKGCKIHFCGTCMSGTYSKKFCPRCKILFRNPPIRDDLMELRVKDLQRFILSKKVSTKSCVEKKDLVELVIRIHNSERGSSSSPEESSGASAAATASVNVHPTTAGASEASGGGGPRESTKNFPKNYVQSTHREEWISKHNLQSEEDVVVDDFVMLSPMEEASSSEGEEENNRPSESSSESPTEGNRETEPSTEEELPRREEPLPSEEQTSAELNSRNAPSSHVEASSSLSAKSNVVTASPKRFSHQELVQLSEIETEEDLLELSVKQMKEILALNRVMFKGVIEKEELLKIVQRLWRQDKRNNEEKDSADDEELCKICMDAKVDCVMLECGHMCTCISCGKVMSECPICRRYVVRVVKIFKA